MKRRAPIWKKLVEEQLGAGMSHREVALALGLPKGTVATWSARGKKARLGDWEKRRRGEGETLKAGMKAADAKEPTRDRKAEMKAGEADRSVRAPFQKRATFRGVTALDLPGKSREIQSMNFAALKRGTYPPRSWGIPGYLQGAELVEAMRKACAKWRKKP